MTKFVQNKICVLQVTTLMIFHCSGLPLSLKLEISKLAKENC